ncbi:MAG: transposase [Alphaproteobacteria bacterium]|nr:transposase [Alphaproteobacteria bacterium]
MSRSTISTIQFFKLFPDAEAARIYIEGRRWPEGAVCPRCGEKERVATRKRGYYRCNPCRLDFTIRTGTIFERSHVPLHKWVLTMYLLMTARRGISSLQLSKEIGVTQKTAWFMLQRIRRACGNDLSVLGPIVEIDKACNDGKEKNENTKKKFRAGRDAVGKTSVARMGNRGRHGVYCHVSEKRFRLNLGEFTVFLKDRDLMWCTLDSLAGLVTASFGQRIAHQELTA